MMIIAKYILIYFSIILGSVSLSIIFHKKIEKCIMIDIFIKIVLLYIFGLIGQLKLGATLILYLPIIIGIFLVIKNRKLKEIKDNIFTHGIVFFTIIYVFLAISTYAKVSNLWDEYSYWSLASKNMFYHDSLLNYDGMKMNILYPPVPTIWQYFFTRNLNTYSQGIEIFASQILGFSILLQFYENIEKTSSKIVKICIPIIILCLPCIFAFSYFYEAIYADALIGLFIGYILIQLYKEDDKKFLYMSLGCTFLLLSLTKATGFYIALILLGVIFLQKVIENYIQWRKQKTSLKEILRKEKDTIFLLIFLLVIILFSFVSWEYAIRNVKMEYTILKCENIDNSRPIQEGLESIFTSIFGSSEESINLDKSNRIFINHLYQYKAFQLQIIPISIMSYIIITILLHIWMYKKMILNDEKNKFLSFSIAIKCGLIIYIAFLELAYLTKFSAKEMIRHVSLERYLGSYFLGELILTITILLKYFNKDIAKQKCKYVILTAVILLITPLYLITNATIFFGSYNIQEILKIYEIENASIKLKSTVEEKSKIYVVHQNSDKDCDLWKLKYFMIPEIDIDITEKFNETLETQYERKNKNLKEEWMNILKNNYEYLYIIDSDEYFEEFAEDVFESEIKNSTLYTINKLNDGSIKLVERGE